MIVGSDKREKVEFPVGKIVLLDGTEQNRTEQECIPRADAIAEDKASDKLRELFRNDDISFSVIEEYICKHRE